MIAAVRTAIRRHDLIPAGQHVLAAVSGGADSVALLHCLHALATDMRFTLSVAHLDHGIRGREAREDADFVEELATRLHLDCTRGRAAVPRVARRRAISVEMAAREARYTFLCRAARTTGADTVATAHTADDQAETVLLKLARGAGPRGLAGIPRNSVREGIRVVRPALDVTRAQVLAFLTRRGLAWREDATNNDTAFLRNRVRHDILPLLEAKLNPKVRESLCRTAEVLAEEELWLETVADKARRACVPAPGRMDAAALRLNGLALQRRVVRAWLVECGVPPDAVEFSTVDAIVQLASTSAGCAGLDLAGTRAVRRRYNELTCLCADPHPALAPLFRAVLRVPGETVLPEVGLHVTTSLRSGIVKPPRSQVGQLPAVATISRRALGRAGLVVRTRKKGDRIRPLGLDGSKKLQDVFVDARVPADQRNTVPVFEARGEIIWIPGYRIAEGWQVEGPASPSVEIRVERV